MTRPSAATPVTFGRWTRSSPVRRGMKIAVGPYRARFAVLSLLSIVAGLLDTTLLYLVARLAVLLTSGEPAQRLSFGPLGEHEMTTGRLSAAAGVVLLAVAAVNIPLARLAASLCRRTLLRIRADLLEAYLHASWAYRSTQPEGHLQDLMLGYCHVYESVILQLSTLSVAAWGLVTLAIVAIVIAGWIAAVAFAGLAVLAMCLRPLARRVKRGSALYAELNHGYASTMAETTRLSPEIACFDVADAVIELRTRDVERAGDVLEGIRFTSKLVPALFQYGALGLVVVIIWVMSTWEVDDLTAIGPLILLLVRALASARQLQTATQTLVQYSPYVEKLEEEIAALRTHRAPTSGHVLQRLDRLVFDGVEFEYLPGVPVLHDVHLVIEAGDAVGVVGPSGGGKSTMTQLIMRLRHPTGGRILAGQLDLRSVDASSWAALVAMVPQDNKLIRGSVADNVRFHRAGFSDDEVVAAVKAAHLHDEILTLPEGYETEIGIGATELSGGQRQRLGIARALIGRPQLLVLDEPTSALDRRSEDLVRQTLIELRGTTTLVVIAHRPATLDICNRVVQVERGVVRELDQAVPAPA